MRRVLPAGLLPRSSAIVGVVPLTHATVIEPVALRSALRCAPIGSYAPNATGVVRIVQLVYTDARAVKDEVPTPA